jgi:large subunit ribosomal protein L21
MYAIIEDSGTQIKVAEGDVIKVDLRELPEDVATLTFDRVLAVGGTDDAARIGDPYLEGTKVTADIIEEGRDKKVMITKFKRRKGYLRRKGHRQPYIQVKITSIQG